MNILITSAGRRVSLVRAFQKELRNYFPEGKVFTTDTQPMLSSACQVSDGYFKVERVTTEHYIVDLISLCVENNIKLIIPTIDPELIPLISNIDKFTAAGITCLVSDVRLIRICRDKRLTHRFFEDNGVKCAMEFSHDQPQFPLFIKPIDGSGSRGLYYIENETELTPDLVANNKLMFLEYINPKEHKEFTLDLYFDKNGDMKCVVPRQRIEIRSGEIFKGITSKNALVKYVKNHFSNVAGFVGCITLQLFYNAEINYVCGIEINPRFGGGYPLSYHAGANYPKWIVEEYLLGKTIEVFDDWEDSLMMLRYDDEILVHGATH